jgi:iron complex outermembrane receptor protein
MKLKAVLVLIVFLGYASAEAEERVEDTTVYECPVLITVTAPRMSLTLKKLSFSASVIDQKKLEELPRSISVDEPLKLVPGVKVDNQANGSRVHLSIRGQGILTERGIRGTRILLDGIPVNDPTGFAPDVFDVDFNTVDRIEVLRGAAASLYGGSASAGIINILTQYSPNRPLAGEAAMNAGSNDFWKASWKYGGYVNDVNYHVSMSRMMGDGYRTHTHFWGDNVYAKAAYTPTNSVLLTPIFGWTDVYHENPEGINLATYRLDPKLANPDAVPFNESLHTERTMSGLTGSIRVGEHHEFEFSGYAKRTLFTEANNRTFNHRTFVTPGASLQYMYSWGDQNDFIRNKVKVGTDLQWQKIDEYRVDNLHSQEGDTLRSREEIKQRGLGVYLIDRIEFGEKWGTMLSVRYDDMHNGLDDLLKDPYDASGSADFDNTTGSVGVTYSPLPEVTVYSNLGGGFLPPATEELAQNPDNFGGFNKHLTSATSIGVDLGIRSSSTAHLYYDVTGFYLKTKNDFDRYRILDSLRSQETFYRNAGSSRRFGLEVYGRYLPSSSVKLELAYTYSNFKYTISDSIRVLMDDPDVVKYIKNGNWLPNSPRHQLVVDGQYDFGRGLSLGFTSETLTQTYIDGANVASEAADGYTLIHARLIYNWHLAGFGGEISIQGQNLGDTKYVAFTEPDPGGNSYQPGAGRQFFGEIKIKL